MDYLEYKDYLAHHGIEGQKWGVRRYQNADGSLTAAGAQRYHVDSFGRIRENGTNKKISKSDRKYFKSTMNKRTKKEYRDYKGASIGNKIAAGIGAGAALLSFSVNPVAAVGFIAGAGGFAALSRHDKRKANTVLSKHANSHLGSKKK